MPLGSKKLQKVIDAAEQLYSKMNEVLDRLKSVEDDMERTSEQVDDIERDLAEQRALIEALAEEQDIDVEATLVAADLPDADESGDSDETEENGG